MESLVMLGRDYPLLGDIAQQKLGFARACISVGSDPESPGLAYKGNKSQYPNEDGLVVLRDENRWLFAIADGHLGHECSHTLIQGLSGLKTVPARLGPLSLALASADWLADAPGGSTLLIACLDQSSGTVFGLSFGDSSLVTVGASGARVQNRLNENYLRGGGPIEVEAAQAFQFQLQADETLILHSDGVNECCYRDPYRSVSLHHIEALHAACNGDTSSLSERIVQLALAGVEGFPGGQDNIALISFRGEQKP